MTIEIIMIHQFNILIHVVAGSIALVLGVLAIILNSRVKTHQKVGRWFLWFMSAVVVTGFIGWLFFRSDPFLLILVIISGYQAFAGFRVIRLRETAPQGIDFVVAFVSLALAFFYLWRISESNHGMAWVVINSTMVGLTLITVYDMVKYLFLHRYVKTWWLYEHIYKMISAFSAIFSAFTATVITGYAPYSQLGPSVVCMGMIVYFIWRRSRYAL